MFVCLSFSQTLGPLIAGCEAAWEFFAGVFELIIPDIGHRSRACGRKRPGSSRGGQRGSSRAAT